MSESFDKSESNTVRRSPSRGIYDKPSVYEVIDAALTCNVGLSTENGPVVIPMVHARVGDTVLIHGATTSRTMKYLTSDQPVCLSFVHIDGIVLARSLYDHSFNYRSVVGFGHGVIVPDDEKMDALKKLTERLVPGRWTGAREPNPQELRATNIVAISLDSASAKIRDGGPADQEEDYALPHWAGVLPIQSVFGDVEPDNDYAVPDCIASLVGRRVDDRAVQQ